MTRYTYHRSAFDVIVSLFKSDNVHADSRPLWHALENLEPGQIIIAWTCGDQCGLVGLARLNGQGDFARAQLALFDATAPREHGRFLVVQPETARPGYRYRCSPLPTFEEARKPLADVAEFYTPVLKQTG